MKEKNTANKFVLSPEEASEYIGIGINQIRDLCKRREIKAARSGKNWKIPKPYLEEYVMTKAANGEPLYKENFYEN